MTTELSSNSITFGKYKDHTIDEVLKDRSYCKWLLKQEWFQKNYEYLFNKVNEYDPKVYFLLPYTGESKDFLDYYQYFNLVQIKDLLIKLSEDELKCYQYYLQMVSELKSKIEERIDTDNKFNIKAPVRWLKKFEKNYELNRSIFKSFLSSYELPNIPYIVETIKKEGNIEYKGAKSFKIAKERSEKQEKWWEDILKQSFGEDIGSQFKYQKCIFDFLNISTNTIYECKLGLKDFNEKQYDKYLLTLKEYNIVYLIGYDCIIDIKKRKIYTTDKIKYEMYQMGICMSKNPSKFDLLIKPFDVEETTDFFLHFNKIV